MRTRRSAVRAVLAAALTGLLIGCQTAAPDPPRPAASVLSTTTIETRVRDITVESPAVGRPVQVRLLLPERYDAEPDRRWPVLWLLHGCCDSYDSWTRSTGIEEWPQLAGVLVVMPDGGQVGFYSDWRGDGPAWETFHTSELQQVLKTRWRAGDDQAIAGLSMGGLGAMAYAARHHGMFRAAASFSGVLHTGYPGYPEATQQLLSGYGEEPLALWGDPQQDAATWREHNPYDLAAKLKDVELVVTVGNGELGPFDGPTTDDFARELERNLQPQSAAFAQRLQELGLAVTYRAYGAGTHTWPYWERELKASLPTLLGGT